MLKKILPHIISALALFVFIIIGLASTSTTPSVNNSTSTKSSDNKSFFDFFEPARNPEKEGYTVIRLKNNEEPQIRSSYDLENDYFEMLSDYYLCIGSTTYNGISKNNTQDNIKTQCKRIGATMALYSVDYTYTTSLGYRRYDYSVYYFVRFTDEVGFGLSLIDLGVKERQDNKRNTGALVHIVYKRSPAFYANIFRGDIIIKINDTELLDSLSGSLKLYLLTKGDTVNIEILRNGKNEIIKTKY